MKILNVKLMILLEFQNKKKIFKRLQRNWSEKVFVTKKVKNSAPWTYIISDLKGEEIVGTFYKKKNAKNKPK